MITDGRMHRLMLGAHQGKLKSAFIAWQSIGIPMQAYKSTAQDFWPVAVTGK